MSTFRFSHKTPVNPEGKPTCAVVRYGAIGDLVQVMSVVAQIKKDGYWVVLICQEPAAQVAYNDPNVDCYVIQSQNQVPIQQLGHFWQWYEQFGAPGGKRFNKWVNLTESVESNLLISPGNVKFAWHPKARYAFMGRHNYLEFQHLIADVKYDLPANGYKLYSTPEERKWRDEERARMRKVGIEKYIAWALAGSSRTHKVYPHSPVIWKHVMEYYPEWGVVTLGDASCEPFERGFETTPRIWRTSGKYTIRQSLLMVETADVVFSPETGMASAAAFSNIPKIITLSHSSVENLTRDWVNCTSIWAPSTHCVGRGKNEVPCCNKMLPTFEGCTRNPEFGVAQCTVDTPPSVVWDAIQTAMRTGVAPKWEPPGG